MVERKKENKLNEIAKRALYGESPPIIELKVIDHNKLLENILDDTGLTEDELVVIANKITENKK